MTLKRLMRYAISSFILLVAGVTVARAQDYCSAITKYGIFDVNKTNSVDQMSVDIIHWLRTNEFKTEADARSAAAKAGVVIPVVNIPVNADATYGESHSSSWSRAVSDYLEVHQSELHKFSSEIQTANPEIVKAWSDCVTKAVGLICYARQTNKGQTQH